MDHPEVPKVGGAPDGSRKEVVEKGTLVGVIQVPRQALVIPATGNPRYPLPPDYEELSTEGQRLARVNACLQADTPRASALSWNFFRNYYLMPDPAIGFDPMFYKNILPSPPGHYKIVSWLSEHRFLAIGAPRGFAKSTLKRTIILKEMLTKPGVEIATILSKEDFGIDEMDLLKFQFEENERIIEDFGPQRTGHGLGVWNNHLLRTQSRAAVKMFSMDGRIRSIRPDLVFIDDVEYDEDYKKSARETTADITTKVLKVIVSAMEAKSKVCLLGTMLSKQSFLYFVVCTEDDPRFQSAEKGGKWFKINIPGVDTHGHNAWGAKYTKEHLAERRLLLGDSIFRTEFMGDPVSEEDAPFVIRPDLHEYTFPTSEAAERVVENPYATDVSVTYHAVKDDGLKRSTVPVTVPFREKIDDLRKVLAIDYASGMTAAHDYSSIVVGGLDDEDNLWVLDAWFGRVRSTRLAQLAWEYALRWRVSGIAVEAIGAQEEIVRLVRETGYSLTQGSNSWLPAVIPLKYPGKLSKGDRISNALERRFNQGRIKLPGQRSNSGAMYELYHQIRNFTPDLRSLQFDDLVDSLAMIQIASKGHLPTLKGAPAAVTVIERLRAGERFLPGTDIPLATMVPFETLPMDVLSVIMREQDQLRLESRERSADLVDPEYAAIDADFDYDL